jgi:hypothetical protein
LGRTADVRGLVERRTLTAGDSENRYTAPL